MRNSRPIPVKIIPINYYNSWLPFVLFFLFFMIYPVSSPAEWVVNPNMRNEAGAESIVAHNSNDDGYTLEVYMDEESNVRVRFGVYDGLAGLSPDSCPTFQIDRNTPANRSINDDTCHINNSWAEYVFAQVQGRQVTSPPLFGIMNGNIIRFRFRLNSGDYRETEISLAGSKRSLSQVVGENVNVLAR